MVPDFGEVAYMAYSAVVGGKTWDGRPMPSWGELTFTIRAAWGAAAATAIQKHAEVFG